MLIKNINKNKFDLFFNNGWENWARFEISNNKLHQIAGVAVPFSIINYLKKKNGVA